MCVVRPAMECCESCHRALGQLVDYRSQIEELQVQNEVLQIGTRDAAVVNESVIKELRRLLDKETAVVTLLNTSLEPDASGKFPSCPSCAHWREQCTLMRKSNMEEFTWVTHFHKFSRNLQLELSDVLAKEKFRYSQLKAQYDELSLKKTDPFSRDEEIARLRGELRETKKGHSNANQVALMANKVADSLHKELAVSKKHIECMEAGQIKKSQRIQALEEIIDAYRRTDELKEYKVGECQDHVCRKRVLEQSAKCRELSEENAALRAELVDAKNRLRGEEPAKKQAKCARVMEASVFGTELELNLKSFFTIFPGWSSEDLNDTVAFENFMQDVHPDERSSNLKWMIQACAVPETNVEDQGSSKLARKCFSACLKALGGISRKRGRSTFWVNIRQNRAPIFKSREY